MVLENEGLEVTGSARILAAKDRRVIARHKQQMYGDVAALCGA